MDGGGAGAERCCLEAVAVAIHFWSVLKFIVLALLMLSLSLLELLLVGVLPKTVFFKNIFRAPVYSTRTTVPVYPCFLCTSV